MPRKPAAGQAASRTPTSRQRRSEAGLTPWRRGLFEDAALGVALLDLAGIVVDCNAAFSRTLGARRESILRHPLAEHFARDDQDDIAGQFSKLVMGTLRRVRIEGLRRVGNGSNRQVTLFAVSVGTPQPAGLVVHLIDGSDRQSDAAALLHAQKMQAIGQLAGGIAHDFNNLLTAMVGFCELLLVRHPVNDPSHADIAEIRSNATRASHLVRQLLAFSRKQSLKPETVDVAHALAELATMLRRLLGPTIDLRLRDDAAAGDPCLVRVDPGQFDQVIINLAVNARDAMPGGGTLVLRTSPVTIESPIARGNERMPAGTYVRIDVIDSGVGIPKEILGNIFEPFFTTKQPGAGTGLGLSTVYGIVRQTEGFIFVDSAPGKGTHFSIYLPATAAAETDKLPVTADTETGGASSPLAATVLLVDDERPVRMVAARALQQEGYRVIEAESGEDAIDLIRDHDGRIDLLLTDVVMPGIDGFTLARLARQDRPQMQTIVMSGYSEDTLNATSDEARGIHFLQKPFTLAELTRKVSQLAAQTG